jgi:hypothetical protein
MKYIALFIALQIVQIPLTILGIPIVGALAAAGAFHLVNGQWHFHTDFWLWDNDQDGVCAPGIDTPTRWQVFYWSALRNPAHNYGSIPGVSGTGRPLWYWSDQRWYAKAGWLSDGRPCMSAGSGRGY